MCQTSGGRPYVKVCRYNPKHLCPKLNGYGDNGPRTVWSSGGSTHCTCQLTSLIGVLLGHPVYITPCSPLKINRLFGGTYRLHHQGLKISRARNQRENRSVDFQLGHTALCHRRPPLWEPQILLQLHCLPKRWRAVNILCGLFPAADAIRSEYICTTRRSVAL
jgi:hypothetical protein